MTTATAIKERPILFSGPMVRAILDGTKTQTRRVVKNDPFTDRQTSCDCTGFVQTDSDKTLWREKYTSLTGKKSVKAWTHKCPYGQPGDRLWVRETFIDGWPTGESGEVEYCDEYGNDLPKHVWYRASEGCLNKYPIRGWQSNRGAVITGWTNDDGGFVDKIPWKPSIYMKREYSRILLEVTDVRVQRVQEISFKDCLAEGIHPIGPEHDPNIPRNEFHSLWDSINAKRGYGWDVNPWVWCVTFKRIEE